MKYLSREEVAEVLKKDPRAESGHVYTTHRQAGEELVASSLALLQRIDAAPEGELALKPKTNEQEDAQALLIRNGIIVTTGRYDPEQHASIYRRSR